MIKESVINIQTDVFEGPMDLLLHLIKKDNLNIYDINISDITKQYLEYLEIMKSLNLEIAGDFLVMATTLMQIKAKQLLPSQAPTTEEDGPNPTQDLINKIVEYQKFKEAGKYLDGRFEEFKDNFYRSAPIFDSGERVLNLQMFDLLAAVKRAFDKLDEKQHMDMLQVEEFPIEKKMDKIAHMLGARPWVLLDDIFAGETKKRGIITCFLAMLELMKIRKILARQDEKNGEIRLYLNPENKNVDYKDLFKAQESNDGNQ
ncbi:segregation and condensation protein A [Elusimicrobium simillimum]|uniref:segregation and condensation protein A n=1 Tax=Elusimicrobium simillimum TaxID=3143438 RepID=UPI003C6EEC22